MECIFHLNFSFLTHYQNNICFQLKVTLENEKFSGEEFTEQIMSMTQQYENIKKVNISTLGTCLDMCPCLEIFP